MREFFLEDVPLANLGVKGKKKKKNRQRREGVLFKKQGLHTFMQGGEREKGGWGGG